MFLFLHIPLTTTGPFSTLRLPLLTLNSFLDLLAHPPLRSRVPGARPGCFRNVLGLGPHQTVCPDCSSERVLKCSPGGCSSKLVFRPQVNIVLFFFIVINNLLILCSLMAPLISRPMNLPTAISVVIRFFKERLCYNQPANYGGLVNRLGFLANGLDFLNGLTGWPTTIHKNGKLVLIIYF